MRRDGRLLLLRRGQQQGRGPLHLRCAPAPGPATARAAAANGAARRGITCVRLVRRFLVLLLTLGSFALSVHRMHAVGRWRPKTRSPLLQLRMRIVMDSVLQLWMRMRMPLLRLPACRAVRVARASPRVRLSVCTPCRRHSGLGRPAGGGMCAARARLRRRGLCHSAAEAPHCPGQVLRQCRARRRHGAAGHGGLPG
jgi:hypothetical protein